MEEKSVDSEKTFKTEESISIKHYTRLITELRCPGCAYPMKAPILQCFTGHSICETCTKIFEFCPLCKKGFSNIRSLTLEALSAKAHFTCSNYINGCKVRLPIRLLDKHEQQCSYKIVKCFMGKVWGDCNFSCREIDWKMHIEDRHQHKLYTSIPVELTWDLKERSVPLAGYYVIQFLEEMFYLYQIYDQSTARILWTMTCISTRPEVISKFAFEIEVYNPSDSSKIICQRFPCHSENDKDILQEGTCASIAMSDILRFINTTDKILFYKVNIHEIKLQLKEQQTKRTLKSLPKDFQLTSIEGVNHKQIPSELIVTRATSLEENFNESSENSTLADDSGSDAELEMFVNQLASSTPKLNFNKKFFVPKLEGNGDLNEEVQGNRNSLSRFRSAADLSSDKKLNAFERITKSFMNLKADFPDLKSIGRRKNSRNSVK